MLQFYVVDRQISLSTHTYNKDSVLCLVFLALASSLVFLSVSPDVFCLFYVRTSFFELLCVCIHFRPFVWVLCACMLVHNVTVSPLSSLCQNVRSVFFFSFLFFFLFSVLCKGRVSREGFFRHRMKDRVRDRYRQTDRQRNRERNGHRMMDRQTERQTARGTERERQTQNHS